MLIHQYDAKAFLRRREYRGALFMEPGLGKTRVGFECAMEARRTLVMAPLNPAQFVWPQEGKLWAPNMELVLARGSPAERCRILFDRKPDVAVMNYELLAWFYDEVRRRRKLPYDLLLLDESTNAKTQSSIAFRALRALEPAFDAVIPMTGTPAENSLHDVWAQLYLVDRGEALGNKVGVFRERYCSPVLRENYVSWKVTRPEELRKAAAPLCFVRRAVDCLDMPPLVFRDVTFDLADKERKLYDSVKRDHVVRYKDVAYPLDNAGVELDKLRQLTSGFVYSDDDPPVTIRTGKSKCDALVDALSESFGKPVLVGFWYRGSKEAILERIGKNTPVIDRHTSDRDKARYLRDWARGRIPVLLGQIRTVAYGLNMQSPDASILFYDLPWSHGAHWQFIRRVWRQGQATRVMVRRLIARYTVDGYVAMVLKRKQFDEDVFLDVILEQERLAA